MKFYLSSFKIGNQIKRLQEMTKDGNKKVAYIPNALDFAEDKERLQLSIDKDINSLNEIGFIAEEFDLKKYFNDKKALKKEISAYDVVWTRGGNVFVLRQAMMLSGFDKWLQQKSQEVNKMVYGGYSAGVCVLSPSLKGLDLVDPSDLHPYSEFKETIYEGLGIINWAFAPHYKSDHPESSNILKLVEYNIDNKILFRALKDGEVVIIE